MKIWCQLPARLPPSESESFYELIQKHYNLVKRPDTETAIKDVPTWIMGRCAVSLGLKQIHDGEILKSMLRAEKEGFDAVAGACFFDVPF